MKSNYEPIGKHIREVDNRNDGHRVKLLLGLSISKEFIPSVANTIGTDMENYKIIRKNQFACSTMQVRRDKKMPVALLQDFEEAIISQAYPIFEVIDEEQLLPEYLMMWFSRTEFDREACFYAIGGVRGSLEWEDFLAMQLPIPHITKQRAIVQEYNTIQNRIQLNQQLIQKLEETAQAIYKEWFVDFEFPDENGKPYKSSGGEMVWCEELEREIPKGWDLKKLDELTKQICVAFVGSVFDDYCEKEEGVPMLRTTNITEEGISLNDLKYVSLKFHSKNKKSQLRKGDLLVARHGSNGMPVIFDDDFEANALNVIIIKPDYNIMSSNLIYCFLTSSYAKEYVLGSVGGSVQEVLNTKKISELKMVFPKKLRLVNNLSQMLDTLKNNKSVYRRQLLALYELRTLILSKLATIN